MFKSLPFILFISLTFPTLAFADCVLTMAYKEGEKLPLITGAPQNKGAYIDLFKQAADKINCQLKVLRMPKRKIHALLQQGQVDFYPAASYSYKRFKYLHYIDNGFTTSEYGITASDVPEIKSYPQVKSKHLTWLMEWESSKKEIAKKLGIQIKQKNYLNLNKIRRIAKTNKQLFYVVDKELIDYYPIIHKIKSFEAIGLKIHKQCCGGTVPMYLGFSRLSNNYAEQQNNTYDVNQPISMKNPTVILKPGSVAYQLAEVLNEMKLNGTADTIYNRYISGKIAIH